MMDTFPDLGSLSDQELKDLIQQLTDEEQEVSYRRRILHGKIDILRAELVNRLRKKHEGGEEVITGDDVQKLTDILAGRAAGEDVGQPLDVCAGDHVFAAFVLLAQPVDELGAEDVDLPVQDAPPVGHLLLLISELLDEVLELLIRERAEVRERVHWV